MNVGIIVAAGKGERYGSYKQTETLLNKKVYQYSLDVFNIVDLIESKNCDVAFLPHRMLGVDIRLTTSNHQSLLDLKDQIVNRISKYVYGFNNDTIEEVVAEKLKEQNLTVATAESCTAGMLSAKLTNLSGSSQYFNGGVVCYSNTLKLSLIHI